MSFKSGWTLEMEEMMLDMSRHFSLWFSMTWNQCAVTSFCEVTDVFELRAPLYVCEPSGHKFPPGTCGQGGGPGEASSGHSTSQL